MVASEVNKNLKLETANLVAVEILAALPRFRYASLVDIMQDSKRVYLCKTAKGEV
jgi:hypothetical protein